MDTTRTFWLLAVALCAWPLILVGLFAIARRHPQGAPVHKRWTFGAGLVPVWAAGSIYHFTTGVPALGVMFLVLSVAAACWALDLRRRSA
jgi:predicted metal-binding membrane protein